MVGESKDYSIMKMKRDPGSPVSGGEKGSYSRRKKEKKTTKFQGDMNGFDDIEHGALVDRFVQDVIQRAKEEYLKEYGDQDMGAVGDGHPMVRMDESPSNKDRLIKDPKGKETGTKGKHKRKHHYKYSGKVDEKEISGYDTQEDNSLLSSTVNADPGEVTHPNASFYRRSATTLRRLMTCCFGKT